MFSQTSVSRQLLKRARALSPILESMVLIFTVQVGPVAFAQPQTINNQRAGTIVNAIPDETVERPGSVTALPINVNDPVYWEDVLRTLDHGRMRVELLGGSFLNLGVRSSMRVIQHDPGSQQTKIELTIGYLRGEIKKLTAPGANFEVLTPTSVFGVVGTIFEVDTTGTATHIRVLEGKVKVRNRNPRVKGEYLVKKGRETQVDRDKPPEKPRRMSATQSKKQEMTEKKKTDARKERRKETPRLRQPQKRMNNQRKGKRR